MASLWHLLLMVLSSLLLVAGYKLPTLRLLFQDGTSEENVEEARNLPVQAESPLGAPGRWEWKTGGGVSRDDFPQRPRRKRRVPSHSSSPAPLTASTQTLTDTTDPGFVETGTSTEVPATIHPLGENLRDVSTVTTHLNATKSTTPPTRAPATTHDNLYEDDPTEGVTLQSSDDLATSMGITRPQNSSTGGTGRTTVALKGTMEVTTGMWLLVDEATSGTSSRTSEGTADVSTGVTLRQSTVTAGPHLRAKGAARDVSASSTATTVPAKLPSQKSAPGTTTILVGKCLLAIFLLALVAGIFIVITAVLATLLWRQKQAYKLSQHNHTEMVCISSLLAADEAEEAGGRHPRVRRVRMLGENSSEAEMDNLTLNSFLPDH